MTDDLTIKKEIPLPNSTDMIKDINFNMTIEVHLLPWRIGSNFIVSVSGETYEYREFFKEQHMIYTEMEHGGVFGALNYRNTPKQWVNYYDTPGEARRFVDVLRQKFPNLPVKVKFNSVDLQVWYDNVMEKKERLVEMYEAEEALKSIKPRVPDILCGHRWNGKIYGYGDTKRIYLDNIERELTSEELESLQEYNKANEPYLKKRLEIKTNYADVKAVEKILLKDLVEDESVY